MRKYCFQRFFLKSNTVIKKVQKHLKKRKVKVFLIFLVLSSLAWLIKTLSGEVISRATFNLEFVNKPDSLLLIDVSKKTVDVKLEAVGFQFLSFGIKTKTVFIDLNNVEKNSNKFYIPQSIYKKQIEKQLSNTITIKDIDRDTLFFNFTELIRKKVAVLHDLELEYAKNHVLEGEIKVMPDSIIITGPSNEIGNISSVNTTKIKLVDLKESFSKSVKVIRPKKMKNASFSNAEVKVSGVVSRFSEKLFAIPVEVINLSLDVKIEIFPDIVGVLCKANIGVLKDIKESDFQVVVDCNGMLNTNTLPIEIKKTPNHIYSATTKEKEVTYILTRQ